MPKKVNYIGSNLWNFPEGTIKSRESAALSLRVVMKCYGHYIGIWECQKNVYLYISAVFFPCTYLPLSSLL
jgi:hypothetical protein